MTGEQRSIAPRRTLRALLAVAAASLVGACGGGGDSSDTLPDAAGSASTFLRGVIRTPPLYVGDVELPDESPAGGGEPFAMRAGDDGLLLVYFGYTTCPDICPTTLADIGAALRGMEAGRDRVEVAMVTFDPERDTGDVINSYLDHFVEGGHALRPADAEQQEKAQETFRVIARPVEENGRLDFEHTALTYVVDDAGVVLVEWPFGTAPEDMRSDIEQLLDRVAEEAHKETQ
ncbi:MAG: SCO family protein [Acidimicrobiia bacterium]|nr:SCO family protein [Acidimicrobiia bacterium]